ncbi:hypothetical protein [Microbacterium sp.]|uniref:hypothetical protein n=1 Tax=Microbacterium sp. TaxID=51671 RepID=UPI0025D6CE4D|nr:hypothetical protein [Microbacterium sp.]MBT9605755.1 hypothetical protein [Microbacterium sp.]
MTTQATAKKPVQFSTTEFNEGLQFFLMNVRMHLGTAVEMVTDEAHRSVEVDERCLTLISEIARETLHLLDVSGDRIPK